MSHVPSSAPVSLPPRFLFEAVGRAQACKASDRPPTDVGDFLRFRLRSDSPEATGAYACVQVFGWTRDVRGVKRSKCSLRNLRCSLPGIGWLLFQRCVGCGWCHWLPDELFDSSSHLICPRCKAKPSPVRCALWHTYGVCDQCTGEVLDDIPFEDAQHPDSAAVASHVSGA